MSARRFSAPAFGPHPHLIAVAAGLMFASASPVRAEELAEGEGVKLPDVVVTGRAEERYKVDQPQSAKFTAPIRDTPKSVTIISSEVMQDMGATNLQDALRSVPGITFAAGEGGQALGDRPLIRGIGSGSSIFVDGLRDMGTQTREVFALESVEVIKGAESAYGGRGGGGGSVNLVTKQAQSSDFIRSTLSAGTDDLLRGTYDQNWAFDNGTAFRMNLMATQGDVPGRDSVDYDRWGVAPSLALGLGSDTRVLVDFYHLTDHSVPDYSIPYDLTAGTPVTETMDVDSENFYGLLNRDFRNSGADIATVSIAHDFDAGYTVRNVSRYGRTVNDYVVTNPDDSSGNVANGYVYRSTKSRYAITESVINQTDLSSHFSTGGIEHSINTGLELSHERRFSDGYTVTSATGSTTRNCLDATYGAAMIANGDCTSLYDPDPNQEWNGTVARNNTPTVYTTEVAGVYAFDTLALSEHWDLNLGLRWDHYETEARKDSDPTANGDTSDSFINYQLGIVYKPIEPLSLYASYATETTPAQLGTGDEDAANPGSAPGCTSRCSVSNLNLDPEKSATAEIGAKWELFDARLLMTAAVFHNERKDANILVADGVYEQVGKTRVQGAELTATGSITRAWKVFGGYSYLDSELVEGAYNSNAVGDVLPNTPEHSFSLFTTYQVLSKLGVGGGANYSSKVYGNLNDASTTKKYVPDYWRFDAYAKYSFNPNLSMQLNVQNLTDEVYYTKAYSNHYAQLGSARQYVLSLNISF